jgi:hypothetical protein
MATSSASTAATRRLLADAVRRREGARSGDPGSTLKRAAVGVVILALLAWLVLWLLGFFAAPRQIREFRSLVDEQVKEFDKVARSEVPFSADMASLGPVFERMRDLPEDLRGQARDEMERLFRARERAEMKSYFALPAAARQAELDRRIKAEEERRKAREAERATRNADQAVGKQTASNQPQRGGGPGGRGPGGPGGGRGGGEDQRNTRSKQRIDSTSPNERSQRAEYRRAMDARREQLGGPPGGRRP